MQCDHKHMPADLEDVLVSEQVCHIQGSAEAARRSAACGIHTYLAQDQARHLVQ